jgi:hypothetical protein
VSGTRPAYRIKLLGISYYYSLRFHGKFYLLGKGFIDGEIYMIGCLLRFQPNAVSGFLALLPEVLVIGGR